MTLLEQLSFKGKTAVVTGATRGIGAAIAEQFIQLGAEVVSTGTQENGKAPEGSSYCPLDLSSSESIEAFVKTLGEYPSVDVLVNNAGINIVEPIDQLSDENWAEIIHVNLTGPMMLMRKVSQLMKKHNKGGRILNISSIFGIMSKSKRNSYSASKFGLIGLTKSSSLDLAPSNILVNALAPGFTVTDLTSKNLSKEERDKLESQIPLGRFADVSEIAKSAVFLCSDLNTYITGETLVIDGGFTVQ